CRTLEGGSDQLFGIRASGRGLGDAFRKVEIRPDCAGGNRSTLLSAKEPQVREALKILDTDTCIEILRGNRKVIEWRLRTQDQVVTTWVTAAELFYGAAKSKEPMGNKRLVEDFLGTVSVLSADLPAAQFFGILKADLELSGRRLPDADLWIGSLARSNRAAVVTGNTRHFGRMEGVAVENWMR
ncbi:MAG: type II toxin-antitoxin system VapC family toxin, partial [Chthoniobacterales bacterium]